MLLLQLIIIFFINLNALAQSIEIDMTKYTPPIAKQIPHKSIIHKEELIDHYHWLREPSWPKRANKEIITHLKEENRYTNHFFKPLNKYVDKIYKEIIGRIKLADKSIPIRYRNYYYSHLTKETSNYPTYVRRNTPKGKDQILFDGDKEAKNHKYFSIGTLSISPDENLMAYALDTKGNEYYTIRVRNLSSREELSDIIEHTLGSVVWDENMQGFYYTKLDNNWRPNELHYHKLGTKQKEDLLIYKEKDHTFRISIGKSSDHKYILVDVSSNTSDELMYIHATDPKHELHTLIPRKEDHLCSIDHIDEYFYISTNDKGKNFRLVRVKDSDPKPSKYEEIVPHSDEVYLIDFDLYDNYLVIETKEKGLPQIHMFTYDLTKYDTINFPDPTYTASLIYSCHDDDGVFIGYSSLISPSTVFKYNFSTKKLTTIKVQEIPSGYNKDKYECKRVFAPSRDGKTMVPISLMYRKDMFKGDGSNPLFLYGYGSYGVAVPPSFGTGRFSLIDRGFVYAIAHIRGGDDLGFKWYEDAKFLNKKLTFHDFIDCTKHLIDKKYSSKGNVAIYGGSAGGMLIGNAVNEEPDLFKAAIANVPFVDVLNTMLDDTLPLTPGEFKEWGNPKDKSFFDYIKSYSPYENIKAQNYPAMYVLAGLKDPRVTYWEPAKWVAKLRNTKTDDNVLLLETNMSTGHRGKTARFESIQELAKEYAFILYMFRRLG